MDDDSAVPALVAAAAAGDQTAWVEIVDRYTPLLVGVLRQCRLTTAELEDIAQTVWLRLVEHLDDLREARALPKWIVTTGRREAWRYLSVERRTSPQDPQSVGWSHAGGDEGSEEELLRAERHQALLAGLAELEPRQRQLLLLLIEDPPLSYASISRLTGIPVGAIGPTRGRAIERLRRTPQLRAFVSGTAQRRDSARRTRG